MMNALAADSEYVTRPDALAMPGRPASGSSLSDGSLSAAGSATVT